MLSFCMDHSQPWGEADYSLLGYKVSVTNKKQKGRLKGGLCYS